MKYQFLRFPGGISKAVTLSYDDGFPEDKNLAELFNKYDVKCTFNLNGFAPRDGWGISPEEVKEHILSNGHEVAIHGYLHKPNGLFRPLEGIRDVLDCRLELEKIFGIIIRGMAYPGSGINNFANGADYESIVNYLKELDIVYSRSTSCDQSFELPSDWYNWLPTAHHDNPKIMEYIDEFLNLDLTKLYYSSRTPKLLYIWGHAFELEKKNNWNHMEDILRKISRKDNIWYASNIEIYSYTEAYNRLIYSADGTMIYNPTLYTMWFERDEKIYSIDPNETLNIKE